ncbi:class I SAM-dependent methyltransferase [Actinomycetospora straminea]|uniref:Methyltransferase type 12 domain-containing protein n=1 Tax=Actinomycetospora straminea TaxID=663607 RepID=A0ABP9EEM2_9PSEU|nr:class I SAM-dependent methyltransferase [Actinomycetospora straminea]MDD7934488.1 class I SAM-dependent methyltransferase [Actinomycetospora straminea]
MRVPPRLAAAVDLVDPAPDARVLEVGCGRGVAAALLVDRLPRGHYTGVDRSATATAATAARLDGRGEVHTTALAAFRPAPGTVDLALAVNVNVFWTGPARPELAVLATALRPGGVLHLVYGSDGGVAPRGDVADRLTAHVEAAGFVAEVTTPTRRGVRLLHVRAAAPGS